MTIRGERPHKEAPTSDFEVIPTSRRVNVSGNYFWK